MLLLNTANVISQSYVPMAVDSATWLMASRNINTYYNNDIRVLRLEGDTIINDLLYAKIYQYEYNDEAILLGTRKMLGVLRDDIDERKVYGGFVDGMQFGFELFLDEEGTCDWYDSDEFVEYELYDFSMEVGDTVTNCMFPPELTVENIETINRFGYERRSLTLSDTYGPIMTEGIGTCIGIFNGSNDCLITGDASYLLESYCIGSFADCNLITSVEEVFMTQELEIRPNPVSSKLTITNSSGLKKVSLYDINGSLLEHFSKIDDIDVSSYPPGVYIISLLDNNGNVHSNKVVKI